MSIMTACIVCMKSVLDSDDGLQCDEACQRWFHRDCVHISKIEYNQLSKDTRKKWYCGRVDCKIPQPDPIEALTTSVNALIKTISSWSDKINKIEEITDIKNGVETIKTELVNISEDISKLKPKVAQNEADLSNLKTEIKELKASQATNSKPDDLIREINQRAACKSNIIVHGLPECTTLSATAISQHDTAKIKLLISTICPALADMTFKLFRLGAAGKDKIRPVKVILKSETDVQLLLKNFNKEAVAAADDLFQEIGLTRDRTVAERRLLETLRGELEARTRDGEQDLTIKFVFGVPTITKIKSKNV